MKVGFGMKAHSGWAALVVLGERDGEFVVVDRRRIELVEEEWARQPYHAAEDLEPDAARDVVKRGVEAARRIAVREMRAAVGRERERKNEVTACAVLVVDPMPDWSVEEILAVHFRMHKAEKLLTKSAESALGTPASSLVKEIARLGKSVGPPWGKDQKDAALAALVALQGRLK
jgi:hypothetical protein